MKTVILIVTLLLLIAAVVRNFLLRRRYTKQLNVAVKRAQKSEQLKSAFIDNISRTLRTPLNAIAVLCNTILEEKDEEIQLGQVRKIATDISENSKELTDFVAQLHEMSKFEGVNPSFTFIEVNLSELMASYRREAMNYTKPEVNVRVTTDLSPHCRGILDTNLMHQLMMQLLTNAAKNVTQGDIFIKYTCERRGLKVSVNYIDFEQADLINADAVTLIQREDALKDSSKSSILGLAICKAIVDMFGGEFFMESESGKKTVASFWFPCEMKDIYKDI